jgi:lysozyme
MKIVKAARRLIPMMKYHFEGGTMKVQGIDVSNWQGDINWVEVAKTGVRFAFIKATEGTGYVNPKFDRYVRDATAAGIHCGAYHFWRPSTDQTAEALWFVKNAVGIPLALPPVLDIEVPDPTHTSNRLADKISVWLKIVEDRFQRKPIIYTGPAFADQFIESRFGGYPLWIAHYGVREPRLPKSWKSWQFHQYTQSGTCRGIVGAVDQNVFNGDDDEFNAYLRGITCKPITPPTPAAQRLRLQYVVKPGDTLSAIAQRCGVPVGDIMRDNSGVLTNPDKITPGMVLQIWGK